MADITTWEKPYTNHPAIQEESNKTHTSPLVELFEIDLTSTGLGTMGFTNMYKENSYDPIYFNGRPYYPLPICAEGFEWDGSGKLPTPHLQLGTVDKITAALILNNNDLLGCKVTRIRTYARFLDNGDTPNPAARFAIDEYVINRRVSIKKSTAEFELTNVINFENKKLPGNQVIKKYCTYIYRRYKNKKFVYDDCYPCPYHGNKYFNDKNEPCAAPEDRCGKTLTACELRYGRTVLPFQGFPAIGNE